MYSNLFLLTQAQGVLLVCILAMTSGQSVQWLGLVVLSMLAGFGFYVLNVQSFKEHPTESLADLFTARTINGVQSWLCFYGIGLVLFYAVLALTSEVW